MGITSKTSTLDFLKLKPLCITKVKNGWQCMPLILLNVQLFPCYFCTKFWTRIKLMIHVIQSHLIRFWFCLMKEHILFAGPNHAEPDLAQVSKKILLIVHIHKCKTDVIQLVNTNYTKSIHLLTYTDSNYTGWIKCIQFLSSLIHILNFT